MTRLSVNINKVALIRNSRIGNLPDVLQVAKDCEHFGAEGITVHPRPDERHIRYNDVINLKSAVTTELNVEGNPISKFMNLVLDILPDQVTLVPDLPDALTSDNGWDTIKEKSFLTEIISELKNNGIRTSIFVNPDCRMIDGAKSVGADRIELYTESYAKGYLKNKEKAIKLFVEAANHSNKIGIGFNAGHDLNLENLNFFNTKITGLLEVSIGHALISDSLYLGLENTIQLYLRELKK